MNGSLRLLRSAFEARGNLKQRLDGGVPGATIYLKGNIKDPRIRRLFSEIRSMANLATDSKTLKVGGSCSGSAILWFRTSLLALRSDSTKHQWSPMDPTRV